MLTLADPNPYLIWDRSQTGVGGGRNLADYVSTCADLLLEEARRTTDQNRCLEFHYNSQVIFHSDVPNLPLYCPIDPYFVSEQLLGLELGTRLYSSSRFSNIHEWSLEKDLDSRGP